MSVTLSRDQLTLDQKKLITQNLQIIAKDPYEEEQRARGVYIASQSRPNILFWSLVAGTSEVRIPKYFGETLYAEQIVKNTLSPIVCPNQAIIPSRIVIRPYQEEVAMEALDQLEKHSTTTIVLRTGWGKTILGAWLSLRANLPILVLINRETIARAWYKVYRESLIDGFEQSVWMVGEPANFSPPAGWIATVTICMTQRIHKLSPEYLARVGVLVLDEIHTLTTPSQVNALLATSPRYVIAESATPTRNDGLDRMMKLMVGDHYVTRPSIQTHRVYAWKTSLSVPITAGPRGLDFNALTNSLTKLEARNDLIVDFVCRNISQHKIMIFTRRVEHANYLHTRLLKLGISVATLMKSQRAYVDSAVLIGVLSKMGTGFDEANFATNFGGVPSNLALLTTSIKDVQSYLQTSGRVMRSSDPVIVYMIDDLNVVKNHFAGVKSTIKASHGEISTLSASLEVPSQHVGVNSIHISSEVCTVEAPKALIQYA